VRLLTDRLGGMDDPAKWDRREKSKLAQARLQEVCFFAASVARRLHPRPSESFDSIAPALSRIRPDARLWLVSLQSRSARSLLKLEQLILCALGVLCGQNAFG
jgi:hypothetical protein